MFQARSYVEDIVEIKYGRPGRLRFSEKSVVFANSVSDFRKIYGLVQLTVCSSLLKTWPNRPVRSFEWIIANENNQEQYRGITHECQTSWIAPQQVP